MGKSVTHVSRCSTLHTISSVVCAFAMLLCVSTLARNKRLDLPKDFSTFKTHYLYDALIFEIAPISSCSPDGKALARFRSSLETFRICRAENVVFLVQEEIPSDDWMIYGYPFWTYNSIDVFEDKFRKHHDPDANDRVGVVFVAYLSGPVLENPVTVSWFGGLQYADTSFAVWKDGAKGRESGVLLHELAHMIGVREESDEPRFHCPNRACVLWTTAPSSYSGFCPECLSELAFIINERRR